MVESECYCVTMAVCILCTCPFVFKPLSISDAARMCVCVKSVRECLCFCLSVKCVCICISQCVAGLMFI